VSPSNYPTLNPTTSPTDPPTLCDLVDKQNCSQLVERSWLGSFEIAQTHVVKAIGENRRAPRMIAHREAELLFMPLKSRRLTNHDGTEAEVQPARRIESVGKVYLLNNGTPIHDRLADTLLDGTDSLFLIDSQDVSIVIDLKHLRIIEKVSLVLSERVKIDSVQIGLRYDDGQNTEEQKGMLVYPITGWMWHDLGSSTDYDSMTVTLSIPKRTARYLSLRLNGGQSQVSNSWLLRRVEVLGYLDGLGHQQIEKKMLPKIRSIDPHSTERSFIPSQTDLVRVAVYSASNRLLGVTDARDPSMQRPIFENQVSTKHIDPYSDTSWSATIPFNWVEEGNIVVIGCIDSSQPNEVLVQRLELTDLAQFSEHSITRTKMAIFGTKEDVSTRLNPTTFSGRKLARNLHAVMPVAELKWADTDFWHLPYLVIISKDGTPALVNSEEERRTATGVGTEISWEVMKNFLSKFQFVKGQYCLVPISLIFYSLFRYSYSTCIGTSWTRFCSHEQRGEQLAIRISYISLYGLVA
jgi:hypothetical protein